MSKQKRKKTIADNVARRTAVILFAALLVLLPAAYLIVSDIVRTNIEKRSDQLVTMLADELREEYERAGLPLIPENPEIAVAHCDYLCGRFDIDYAFVLYPEPEQKRYTYICLSCRDKSMEQEFPNHYIGQVTQAEYSQQELDLWYGAVQYSHLEVNKYFGHEMITETIVTDTFGNRISVGVDVDVTEIYRSINRYFLLNSLLLIAVIIAVDISLHLVIRRYVSNPAKRLSSVMQNFAAGKERAKLTLGDMKCGEYEMIADAFGTMSKNIDEYVEHIETLSKAQAKQQTSLEVASGIQKGFLPGDSFENARCAISAMMKPATDVAGDLYDYAELEDGKVLAVIADVSGKGIAASLFMAVTLTLIRQFAMLNLTPDDILRRTNEALIPKNPRLLFVTAFVAIYDGKTGTLKYSNAGHCPPYIAGGRTRRLTGGMGVLLGLFSDETYPCAEETLEPGESLLLYTDGITEALNKYREMFGEERLAEAMTAYRAGEDPDLVQYVCEKAETFAAECEQRDDITLLSLTRKPEGSL